MTKRYIIEVGWTVFIVVDTHDNAGLNDVKFRSSQHAIDYCNKMNEQHEKRSK